MSTVNALSATATTAFSATGGWSSAQAKPAATETLQVKDVTRAIPYQGPAGTLLHPSVASTAGPSSDDDIVPTFIALKMCCTGMTRKQAELVLAGLASPQE